jgi:anti-sigma factor RsiW
MMAGDDKQHVIESGAWSAWLDGELSERERAQVEAHLSTCAECRRSVEAWQVVRRRLAGYAPPPANGAAAQAFWARLQPELAPAPRPRPDPALYLAPAGLAAALALLQSVGLAWQVIAPLGAWQAPAAAWRWFMTSSLLGRALGSVAAPPLAGWSDALWTLAGQATVWTASAALAAFYAAWLVLWLRPPPPRRAPGR